MTPHATVLSPGQDRPVQTNRRRSLRIPSSVPLIVSGFEPYKFSECCGTVTVSAHGCQIHSFRPLKAGMQVRLHAIYDNRVADATVIHVEAFEQELSTRVWNCGLALDKPGNFWTVPSPPCDWSNATASHERHVVPPVSPHGQERRTPATEEVPDKLGRLSRELQQTASAVDARIAGFEACLDQATAEFEKGALTRLQHSFGEAIKQGQERMKRYAEACGESRLVDLEAELERRLEPFLKRTQAARNELVRLLETLRQEQATWEARMAEWRQYEQGLQGWLAEETQRIHATAHDAVVEATGQIKGRMDTLADGTREVLERRMQDAEARLQTLVVRKADDLSRRLLAVEEETGSSFRARLEAQQAEVLDLFRRQARAAMGQAVAQMSETLNAAFGSVPRAPQDHLPDHTAQPPDQAGAGMDGNG